MLSRRTADWPTTKPGPIIPTEVALVWASDQVWSPKIAALDIRDALGFGREGHQQELQTVSCYSGDVVTDVTRD